MSDHLATAADLEGKLERAQAEIHRLTTIAERTGTRWCMCSIADRARDHARTVCPHHGEPRHWQKRAEQAESAIERIGVVLAERSATTQDAVGARRDHWRGSDYTDGEDRGTEVTVAAVRAALNGDS